LIDSLIDSYTPSLAHSLIHSFACSWVWVWVWVWSQQARRDPPPKGLFLFQQSLSALQLLHLVEHRQAPGLAQATPSRVQHRAGSCQSIGSSSGGSNPVGQIRLRGQRRRRWQMHGHWQRHVQFDRSSQRKPDLHLKGLWSGSRRRMWS